MQPRSQSGAATVEHAGLTLLIALLAIAAIAALASGSEEAGRDLGSTLARKIRCAAVGPGPCWRDPLTEAYGRPLAGAVRALAPAPLTRPGASGAPLLPVDFRRCRSESCAIPGERPGLTASNRRVTDFVAVDDRRSSGGPAEITYWLYRPTLALGAHRPQGELRRRRPARVHAVARVRRPGPGRARDPPGRQPLRLRGTRGAAVALADRPAVALRPTSERRGAPSRQAPFRARGRREASR